MFLREIPEKADKVHFAGTANQALGVLAKGQEIVSSMSERRGLLYAGAHELFALRRGSPCTLWRLALVFLRSGALVYTTGLPTASTTFCHCRMYLSRPNKTFRDGRSLYGGFALSTGRCGAMNRRKENEYSWNESRILNTLKQLLKSFTDPSRLPCDFIPY